MNAIIKAPLQGELIAPGVGIGLRVAAHPLLLTSELFEAPAGLTIDDLVEFGRAQSETRLTSRFLVFVDGHEILEQHWRLVRPKPGTTVLLRAVAGFGGNNLLQSLLSLAVVGLGIFLAPIIAPIIGLSAGLVGAAITVGGQLLINALFPVAAPQLSSTNSSPTYSLSGGQNSADPFGVVPSLLGKNRYTPKLGALTYTETIGADQYLRMLVVWGYGPLDISDIKIGETLLSNFSDVEIETRQGYGTDAPVTLYPGEVIQTDLSIALTVAAGWQVRTSATAVDELSIDIVAPGGIVDVDSSGNSNNYTVTIVAQYSPTGAGTWSPMGTLVLTARSTDVIRQGLRVTVANGQYDVRVQKTGTDYTGSDHVQEDVDWTALRSFRNTPPISFSKPLALTALRIRATSQLNGVIDNLNAICQSKQTSYDGVSAWVADQLSINPADLFRLVLQGPANARPRTDDQIDLDTLGRWWSYCKANNFAFNMVRDFTASVYDTLTDIAAAGRAVQVFNNGKWSVVWDDPAAPIVQHFSPRNSWGFTGTRTYVELPHAFRVRFVNEQNGYQQDERIVYDDGYTALNATLFEQIEFPGITDPAVVWRHGRFHIAQARLRPEIYTLNADIEHVVCTRGDRVRVVHDVPEWGLAAGRVKAVAGQVLTLDEPVTMATGTNYSIRFRLADGTSLLRNVVTDDGEQTIITLNGSGAAPAVGDLWMFGQLNAESVVLRVRSITPAEDMSAKITFVDDAPAISSADSGAIPAFSSQITAPVDLFTEAPVNLKVVETFQGIDGGIDYGANFSWETSAGQFPVSFETQFSDVDVDGIWKDGPTIVAPLKTAFVDVIDPGNWSFRVRSIYANGAPSDWAAINYPILSATGVPLPQVAGIRTTFKDGFMHLYWNEINDFRNGIRYKIKKGSSYESAIEVNDVAHDGYVVFGSDTFWVAGYWRSPTGVVVYSSSPTSLVVSGNMLVQNIIRASDQQAAGWPGTFTGVAKEGVDPTAVIRLDGAGSFLGISDFLGVADLLSYGGVAPTGTYEISSGDIVDIGYVADAPINVTWTAVGSPAGSSFLAVADFLGMPDLLGAASSVFIDVHPEIAIDANPATGAFGSWQKFVPGVYSGRRFKFRLALSTLNAATIAYALSFVYQVTVPGRIDHFQNVSVGSGGMAITYWPDGAFASAPFNGGPDLSVLPYINVTYPNQTGDYYTLTSPSLAGVTIQFFNSVGTAVARTGVNITVEGY